ncbi:MAG: sigma 54-interacting transcriptional regulator [Polyangiaceae bacterium]|nr:sigma 54-interacting transcriptional regulator [Polyangiaceae bacterium]
MKPEKLDPSLALTGDALAEVAGASILLDADLRIVVASPHVRALLGFDVPPGELAPKVLCGTAPKRPVAEALVAGKPVLATIDVPRAVGPDRRITVRSLPLGTADHRSGFLLLLSDAGIADEEGPVLFHGMWTQDAGMKRMFRIVERVAEDDVTVLVRGETGAGKELVARALHELSPRHQGPFVAINCAALPETLLESELFGHARGSFTGAVKDTLGLVQKAHKGTLFLDEVAEMPLPLQAKLLRVIETRTVIPVGARDPIPVDVRFVSATHRALRKEVEAGRFRADLMYRLRVIPIFLPPLRERPGDIRLLCDKLIEEFNATRRRRIEHVSPAALEVLLRYDFPGNVRELKNVLQYAYAIGDGPILLHSDLPPELFETPAETVVLNTPTTASPPGDLDPDTARILRALERTGGSRERAAQLLGMSRVTLWRRMRELGIQR